MQSNKKSFTYFNITQRLVHARTFSLIKFMLFIFVAGCHSVNAETQTLKVTIDSEKIVNAFFGADGRGNYARDRLARWETDQISVGIYVSKARDSALRDAVIEKYKYLVGRTGKELVVCDGVDSAHSGLESCDKHSPQIFVFVPNDGEDLVTFYESKSALEIKNSGAADVQAMKQDAQTKYKAGQRCVMQIVDDKQTFEARYFVVINAVREDAAFGGWSGCLKFYASSSVGIFPISSGDVNSDAGVSPELLDILYTPVFKSGLTREEVRERIVLQKN